MVVAPLFCFSFLNSHAVFSRSLPLSLPPHLLEEYCASSLCYFPQCHCLWLQCLESPWLLPFPILLTLRRLGLELWFLLKLFITLLFDPAFANFFFLVFDFAISAQISVFFFFYLRTPLNDSTAGNIYLLSQRWWLYTFPWKPPPLSSKCSLFSEIFESETGPSSLFLP